MLQKDNCHIWNFQLKWLSVYSNMKLKHQELDWEGQQLLFQVTFDEMGSTMNVLATSKHDVSYVKRTAG